MCCHNPALADERARKRAELLAATENQLQTIAAATRRPDRPLRGQDKIALRVGKVRNKFKMAKHFDLDITDEAFSFTRNQDSIAAEAALDGIYVLRTSLPAPTLWAAMRWCCATKTSPTSNASSAPSTANWTCAPSGTGSPTGSARTCSYACCPTTSAGT